jgi:acylphosphatase
MTKIKPPIRVRLRIEGRVQGVGFRAFVEREAVSRGVAGWVRNRRDGGVEVVLSGDREQIDQIIDRCRAGPRGSRADMVKVIDEDGTVGDGFEVRPTV